MVALVVAAVASPIGARAAEPTYGTPTASATYGTGVTFEQPFTPAGDLRRVELLWSSPGALGNVAVEVPTPPCCQPTTLSSTLAEKDSHLVPNTRFTARWRATATDGTVTLGPETSILYADTRFDWKTVAGSIVRVHWYQGSDAFGRRALEIGEKGIEKAATLLGVTETEPVDFFVYADQDAFYDALGPGTRENVGGEAHADIRTMFAHIVPDDIDASWVNSVVPHELTHLVFDTAVKNPYHFPPRWLNEGLAVYLSEGYSDSWRSTTTAAVRSDAIIPLDGLTGQFPTTHEQFALAYAESVSAVDYLVRTYGKAALVKLVRSYADGVTDDEAFQAGIGSDVAGFQAGWLKDLGAKTPTAAGPRPGLAGPLPAGWAADPAAPVASALPGATAGSGFGGGAGGGGLPVDGPTLLTVLVIVAVAAVFVVMVVVRSRRRARESGA
ncbi:MAG TPA: peptidase MA family metallohydrolase [Patescibacteria group bacterium]|nr:peptidase MA family metallohydrolase [Patescibacteria group bacterium]